MDGDIVSQIGPGLLCLIGVGAGDTAVDAEYIARKILNLRVWPSADGSRAWDQSVTQRGLEILCVSQFTLYARPSGNKLDFSRAMPPQQARAFYSAFLERLQGGYDPLRVRDGVFGAMMDVALTNDGPVTLTLESPGGGGAVPDGGC